MNFLFVIYQNPNYFISLIVAIAKFNFNILENWKTILIVINYLAKKIN